MSTDKIVSVIMPIYNEAKYIDKTLKTVVGFCDRNPNYHFLLINDGSTDSTQSIIDTRLKLTSSKNITCLSYAPNRGKGYAVKTGVEYANGDYICYIDSDLAYSLDNLELIVKQLEHLDIVMGCRSQNRNNIKKISLLRKIAGQTFNYLARFILNLPFTDTQAGIKGFRNSIAKNLFKRLSITGFSFDVELIYIAWKKNYRIGEIPVLVLDSHLSKKSKVNIIQDSLKMLLNLLEIRYNDKLGKYE